MIAIFVTITALLACSVLGAPKVLPRATCSQAASSGITRGCDSNGLYYVCAGGVETLYKCQGGCTVDNANQPRCNDGVVSGASGPVPISVVPIS